MQCWRTWLCTTLVETVAISAVAIICQVIRFVVDVVVTVAVVVYVVVIAAVMISVVIDYGVVCPVAGFDLVVCLNVCL